LTDKTADSFLSYKLEKWNDSEDRLRVNVVPEVYAQYLWPVLQAGCVIIFWQNNNILRTKSNWISSV